MPTQVVTVPAAVLAALGKATKRVIVAFAGGHEERLGLLPAEGGGRYLMLRKSLCQQLGLEIGQELTLTLRPDPNPDAVDLPDELHEALAAWPAAADAFAAYSASHRRAMCRHVSEAKQAATRARRAVQLAERLGRGLHPFRGG